MNTKKLMKVTYYDPNNNIRLTGYSDTVVWDDKGQPTLMALRFGGYPEEVRGLADAIFGGITIEIESEALTLKTLTRQYRREISHDGVYAEATLIVEDDGQQSEGGESKEDGTQEEEQTKQDLPPRNTYIFCTPGDRAELFCHPVQGEGPGRLYARSCRHPPALEPGGAVHRAESAAPRLRRCGYGAAHTCVLLPGVRNSGHDQHQPEPGTPHCPC